MKTTRPDQDFTISGGADHAGIEALPPASSLTSRARELRRKDSMPLTPSKPLYAITVPKPAHPVRKATVASILKRPAVSTEQALKGY
ncbi:MAG: hypothetical protein ACKOEZ_04960, partial [Spartobacteria bacterium]